MWIMDVRIITYFFRTVIFAQCFEPISDVPTDYSMCDIDTLFFEKKK